MTAAHYTRQRSGIWGRAGLCTHEPGFARYPGSVQTLTTRARNNGVRVSCCGGEIFPLDSPDMRNRPDDGTAFLRARREFMGWTVTGLARVCGITPGHLSNIEAGRRRPSPAVARTLAYHLDVSPSKLMPAAEPAGAAA